MSFDPNELAATIRHGRKLLQLSHQQLAERARVRPTLVRQLERGVSPNRQTMQEVIRLIQVLPEVSVDTSRQAISL